MEKNSFTLGKNENKKSDKSPDYRGKFMDESGKIWELAGWVKTNSKDGTKFISGTVKEPLKKTQDGLTVHPEIEKVLPPTTDDLPF